MADKASNYATYTAITREELGDSTKYVKIISKDKNGEKIKPVVEIDKEKNQRGPEVCRIQPHGHL